MSVDFGIVAIQTMFGPWWIYSGNVKGPLKDFDYCELEGRRHFNTLNDLKAHVKECNQRHKLIRDNENPHEIWQWKLKRLGKGSYRIQGEYIDAWQAA